MHIFPKSKKFLENVKARRGARANVAVLCKTAPHRYITPVHLLTFRGSLGWIARNLVLDDCDIIATQYLCHHVIEILVWPQTTNISRGHGDKPIWKR